MDLGQQTVPVLKTLVLKLSQDYPCFCDGLKIRLLGSVTESQKTLIADGATTVYSTAVYGTILDGKYVQLVTTGRTISSPAGHYS